MSCLRNDEPELWLERVVDQVILDLGVEVRSVAELVLGELLNFRFR